MSELLKLKLEVRAKLLAIGVSILVVEFSEFEGRKCACEKREYVDTNGNLIPIQIIDGDLDSLARAVARESIAGHEEDVVSFVWHIDTDHLQIDAMTNVYKSKGGWDEIFAVNSVGETNIDVSTSGVISDKTPKYDEKNETSVLAKQCFDVVLSRMVEETLTVTIMAASEAEAIDLANAEADTGERVWESGFYGGERRTVESVTVNPAQKMTLEEWIAHYKPVTKPDTTGTDFASDFLHETFGADLAAVQAANQKCVWTLLDVGTDANDDDGESDDDQDTTGLVLVNGARFVDRLNYFITEVPFDDSNGVTMEVAY